MSKEKDTSITDAQLIAKLSAQLESLSADIQSLKQQNQQAQQQTSSASTLVDLVSKVATSSSRDTDVNAEEAMKAYSPMWPLKANMSWAQEFANLSTIQNQASQILQNAINQANILNTEATAAAGRRIGLYDKYALAAGNHPTYFAENAPASQDTGGEGDDTGDKE